MLKKVCVTEDWLKEMRTDDNLSKMVSEVSREAEQPGMSELRAPGPVRPPANRTGPAKAHAPENAEERRPEFFAVVDRACRELNERFDPSTSGLRVCQSFENALVRGEVDTALDVYPELDVERLSSELKLWKHEFPHATTLGKARTEIVKMDPATRHLFRQAEVLVRLMLLCAVTSCEANEGSVSTMRRFTWV